MQKVGKAMITMFEGFLVVGLHKDRLEVFGKLPEFDAQIDNKKKLHLISTKFISYTKKIQNISHILEIKND